MRHRETDKSLGALVFSVVVHIGLAAGILYAGFEAVSPPAYVDLEVDFVDMDPPKGSQSISPNVSKKESAEAIQHIKPKPKPVAQRKVKKVKTKKVVTATKSPVAIPAKISDNSQIDEINSEMEELDKSLNEPTQQAKKDMAEEYDKLPDKLPAKELAPHQKGDAPINSVQNVNENYGSPDAVRSFRELRPIPGNPKPQYPRFAQLRRFQGTAILDFYVDQEGQVKKIRVIQSSGYASLDNSAIAAVKKWRFKKEGKVGWFRKPIRYRLKGAIEDIPSRLRRK